MSLYRKNGPPRPPIEEEPSGEFPAEEPVRDDAGWQRSSPDRPAFTGRDETVPDAGRGLATSDEAAGEAENIAARRGSAGKDREGHSSSEERPKVEASIEVDVPVSVAYNQWTQFEEFPLFMDAVEQVVQLDDKRLRWVADIAGKRKEWTAEIAEQQPDRCIAWHSTSGVRNAGRVDFEPLGANRTRIRLVLDYEPETTLESAGDWLGLVKSRVKGDLERFKNYIEAQGTETGAWRGRIHGGHEE